jgi:hypothetical protein
MLSSSLPIELFQGPYTVDDIINVKWETQCFTYLLYCILSKTDAARIYIFLVNQSSCIKKFQVKALRCFRGHFWVAGLGQNYLWLSSLYPFPSHRPRFCLVQVNNMAWCQVWDLNLQPQMCVPNHDCKPGDLIFMFTVLKS